MITQPAPPPTTSHLSTREPAIEVDHVVPTLRKRVPTVDGIDLVAGPREIYGFLGPNGVGA
jgi:ABC-type multidrug transport system ATPase subunit